jgi:hypothetical protein
LGSFCQNAGTPDGALRVFGGEAMPKLARL